MLRILGDLHFLIETHRASYTKGLAPPALCLEPHKTKVNGQVKGERINFCIASVKRWDMRIAVATFVRNRVQQCLKMSENELCPKSWTQHRIL